MSYFRKNIRDMEGYKPGEQLGEGYVKLNTNENPYPPSQRVIEALGREAGDDLRLYPAPLVDALREKAASERNEKRRLGCPSQRRSASRPRRVMV